MRLYNTRVLPYRVSCRDGRYLFRYSNGVAVEAGEREARLLCRFSSFERPVPLSDSDLSYLRDLVSLGVLSVGRPVRRFTVVYKFTDACNFRCTYCYESKFMSGSTKPSYRLFSKLYDTFFRGTRNGLLILHGGEPLLYPHFVRDVFLRLSSNSHRVGLQTNGSMLKDLRVSKLLARLSKKGLGVGISLDGFREHNTQRVYPNGSETFDDVLEGISLYKSLGGSFGIVSVITNRSLSSMTKLLDFFISLGAGGCRMNPVSGPPFDFDRYVSGLISVAKRLIEHNISSDSRFDVTNISELVNAYFGKSSSVCTPRPCGAGMHFFTVRSNGSVYPCDHVPIVLGNILDSFTPSSAWGNSSLQRYWLDSCLLDDFGCSSCPFSSQCSGQYCFGYRLFDNVSYGCYSPFFRFLEDLVLSGDDEAIRALSGDVRSFEVVPC